LVNKFEIKKMKLISISIVSHQQGHLLNTLLNSLKSFLSRKFTYEFIVTLNIPETEDFIKILPNYPFIIIRNKKPKGFGANHNSAFSISKGNFFLVLNPDIYFTEEVFTNLIAAMSSKSIALSAPLVLSMDNSIEDSARKYPTFTNLLYRFLTRFQKHKLDYFFFKRPIFVEWAAGMFLLFKREAFLKVSGFDERFYMYMEDADICRRINSKGFRVLFVPNVSVIHFARRSSRVNPIHTFWHLKSAFIFLFFCD